MHPGNVQHLIGIIFAKGNIVFRITGNHAGTATGTLVQVYNHSKFLGVFVFHQHPLEIIIF
jgi:hypothetical protein